MFLQNTHFTLPIAPHFQDLSPVETLSRKANHKKNECLGIAKEYKINLRQVHPNSLSSISTIRELQILCRQPGRILHTKLYKSQSALNDNQLFNLAGSQFQFTSLITLENFASILLES
jgi:hypothetical protein